MDIVGFYLSSGLALLIVLLGWADVIAAKSREVKELEADFTKKVGLKNEKYQKIVSEGGATTDSFNDLVEFLYTNEEKKVVIFEKIKTIRAGIKSLSKKYDFRFNALVVMTEVFFIMAGIAFVSPEAHRPWALTPIALFVFMFLKNLLSVRDLEKRMLSEASQVMEKL